MAGNNLGSKIVTIHALHLVSVTAGTKQSKTIVTGADEVVDHNFTASFAVATIRINKVQKVALKASSMMTFESQILKYTGLGPGV